MNALMPGPALNTNYIENFEHHGVDVSPFPPNNP
jgi:hypothetical protein